VAYRLRRLWWRVVRPVIVGVRVVVRDDQGRLLVVRHRYGRDVLHLPGGGVKRGESLPQAAARELGEEGGVDVDPDSLVLVGAYTGFREGSTNHVIVYEAPEWTAGEVHAFEIAETLWVDPADETVKLSGGTRRRLAELAGAPRSSKW
jgi:8-oxo-dGTP pyrophosphatase MutT (NUDIX family)